LNITERKRGVRSYLGCYLGLVDDDRCSVLEDEPLSHHLIMRVEELIQLGVVHLERLVILLHQCVECGLDDIVFVKVGSVGAEVFLLHA
jgi:hypothetical protein